MKLTKNFNLSEFQSKCGRPMPDDVRHNIVKLAQNLQTLRDYLNASITINSGYRSAEHNAKIGGAKNSKHILGQAADIRVAGHTPKQVAAAIEHLISTGDMLQGGLGIYSRWVHYDISKIRARW